MGLKYDDWLLSYKEATKGDHSFLYINFQQPRRMRMWQNFDQVLFHKEEEEIDPTEEIKKVKTKKLSKNK